MIKSFFTSILFIFFNVFTYSSNNYNFLIFDRDIESTKLLSSAHLTSLDKKLKAFNDTSSYQIVVDFDALVKDLSKRSSGNEDKWEKKWLKERNKKTYDKLNLNVDGKKKGVMLSALFLLEKPVEKGSKWKSQYYQFISSGEDVPLYFRTQFAGYSQETKLTYNASKTTNNNHLNKAIDFLMTTLASDPSEADNYIEIGPFAVSYDTLEYDFGSVIEDDNRNEYVYYKLVNPVFLLNFKEDNVAEKSLNLTGASVSFYLNENSGQFKEGALIYDGTPIEADKIEFFKVAVPKFNIEVKDHEKSDGQIEKRVSGSVTLTVSMEEDAELMPLVFVKKGVSGECTFNFDASTTDLSGSFDFGGVEGINVQYKPKGKIVAEIRSASLDTAGVFSGTFALKQGVKFATGAANLEFKTLSLGITYDLKNHDVSLTKGSGTMHLKDVPNVTGYFRLAMEYHPDTTKGGGYVLELDMSKSATIEINGMIVSGLELEIKVDADSLIVEKIEGKAKMKHQNFNAQLEVSKLLIEDGVLTELSGSGKVIYKEYSLDMSSFEYKNYKVVCSAKINIKKNWVDIKKLSIDSAGVIDVSEISGNIDEGLLKSTFKAKFKDNLIKGSLTGKISTFGIACSLDIGTVMVHDTIFDYDYGYGMLTLSSTKVGLPLTPLPLKIDKIGGRFGYNYKLEYKDESVPSKGYDGAPQKERYVVGVTLGVSDLSKMIAIEGTSIAQFGGDTFRLDLLGEIKVPASKPYVKADAAISYQLPANKIAGAINVDVKIPESSGKIINTENLGINFSVDSTKWHVFRDSIKVNVLEEVKFTGSLDLHGEFENENNVLGYLQGKGEYSFEDGFEKQIALADYEIVGMSATLSINAEMNLNVQITEDTYSGKFDSDISGSSSAALSIMGVYELSVSGNISSTSEVTVSNEKFSLKGDVEIEVTAWGDSKQIAGELDYEYTF